MRWSSKYEARFHKQLNAENTDTNAHSCGKKIALNISSIDEAHKTDYLASSDAYRAEEMDEVT